MDTKPQNTHEYIAHQIVLATCVLAIMVLEGLAIYKGEDGVNFSIAIAAVSALGGFKIGSINNKHSK